MRLKNKIVAGLLTVVMIVSGIAVSSVSYDRAITSKEKDKIRAEQNKIFAKHKPIIKISGKKQKKLKIKNLDIVQGKKVKITINREYDIKYPVIGGMSSTGKIQEYSLYKKYKKNKKKLGKMSFNTYVNSKNVTTNFNSVYQYGLSFYEHACTYNDGYMSLSSKVKYNLKKQKSTTTLWIKALKPGKIYNNFRIYYSGTCIKILPKKGIHIEPTKGTNQIRLKLGTTRKVFAIDRKKNTGKNLKYKSSNTKVATVSKSGVLKGVGVGKCTLTVSNKKGQKKNITVLVNKFGLFKSDGSEYEYCSFSEDKYKVKDNIKSYVCKYDDYVRNFSNISKNYDGYYYLNIKCPEAVYTYDWIYPAFEDVSSTTEKKLDLLNNGGGKVNSKYINVVDSLNKVGTYNVGVEDKYSIKESGISGDTWTYGKIQVLMKDGVIKAGSLNMMNKYFMFEFKSKASSNDKFLVIVNYTTPKMPKFITYKTYHVPDY